MVEVWDKDDKPTWAFWRRWWQGVVNGHPIDPQLQLAIVEGIDDDTWNDPKAVAERIAEIEGRFRSESDLGSVDDQLSNLPKGLPQKVESTRAAMLRNRQELPPTFDAILGYISLEIERLQRKNHDSDQAMEEAKRQIAVLGTLYEAISRLKDLTPHAGDMPTEEAEQAEALVRLIYRRFAEWPRAKPGECEDNVAELVDNSYRAALIGAMAYCAPMVGVSAEHGLIAGTVVFGGKKIVETAKAAKDALK